MKTKYLEKKDLKKLLTNKKSMIQMKVGCIPSIISMESKQESSLAQFKELRVADLKMVYNYIEVNCKLEKKNRDIQKFSNSQLSAHVSIKNKDIESIEITLY